jgi:hypothetical protein
VTGPDAAVQLTSTAPAAVTDTVGTPGAPGNTALTASELGENVIPAGPCAVTTNVYAVPETRPAKLHVRASTAVQPSDVAGTPDDVTV